MIEFFPKLPDLLPLPLPMLALSPGNLLPVPAVPPPCPPVGTPPAFFGGAFPVFILLGRVELEATLILATAVVLPFAGGASEGSSSVPTLDKRGGS